MKRKFHAFIDRGSGPPVLLLHAVGSGPGVFERLVSHLARDRRVLCPWLPGYGASPTVEDDPSLQKATALLVADVRSMAPAPIDVLGMSGGGYRALALATADPALVRSVYLLAGLARVDPDTSASLRATASAVRSGVDVAPQVARGGVSARFAEAHPDGVLALERLVREATRDGLAVDLETIAGAPDLRDAVAKLEIPITIRIGDEDAMVAPERSAEILAASPRTILERVPGAGHVLLAEDTEATLASIDRWLAR